MYSVRNELFSVLPTIVSAYLQLAHARYAQINSHPGTSAGKDLELKLVTEVVEVFV